MSRVPVEVCPSFLGPRRAAVEGEISVPCFARLVVEEQVLQGKSAVEGGLCGTRCERHGPLGQVQGRDVVLGSILRSCPFAVERGQIRKDLRLILGSLYRPFEAGDGWTEPLGNQKAEGLTAKPIRRASVRPGRHLRGKS